MNFDYIYKYLKWMLIDLIIACFIYSVIGLIFKFFNFSIILGFVLGGIFSILNFILLSSIVSKAIINRNPKVKAYMMAHYLIRFLLMGILLYIAVTSTYIDFIAVVISLLIPRVAITIYELCSKKNREVKD